MSTITMNDLIGVTKDNESVLGKMLYYSLGNVLIEKQKLQDIGEKIGLNIKPRREAITDAFMSATGDIKDKITLNISGEKKIGKIYIRDNERTDKNMISRELVLEILGDKSNTYSKLGNFIFDKENKVIKTEIYDPEYSHYEEKVERLFNLYLNCYGRTSIETLVENYIYSLECSKISIYGKLYFVPRHTMDKLTVLEALIEEIAEANLNKEYSTITINSMYVTNDEKQAQKMEEEFYNTVQKEIEYYQAQLQRMLDLGKDSQKIISKWLDKVEKLEQKKRRYETLFNKQLNKLNDDFEVLEIQKQELQIRMRKGQLRIAG